MPERDSDRNRQRRHARRLWLVLLFWLCFAEIIAEVSGLFPGHRALMVSVTGLAAALLVLAVVLHVRLLSYLPTHTRPTGGTGDGSVKLASIRRKYSTITDQFTEEQIAGYATALLKPSRLRGRIEEEITPLRRTLQQKVTTILEIPHQDDDSPLLLPLLLPLKGELQDGLRITVDDAPAATLNHREYLLLTGVVLEALLVPGNGEQLTAGDSAKLAKLVDTALRAVARRSLTTDPEELRKVRKCAKKITTMSYRYGESFRAAAAILRRMINHYAIVVVVPVRERTSNRCVVSYERYLIPKLHLAGVRSPFRYLRDRLGLLLGARPVHLNLPLTNAGFAQSYHMFIMGQDGTYVGYQHVHDPTDTLRSAEENESLAHPHRRMQRRRGQRYLHLYLRSVPGRVAERLSLDVQFYEVPPGSLGGAALAATASFILIYVVSLILPTALAVGDAHSLASDFPALVLAFPAVAGALVGLDTRTPALLGGTLSSKASALLTVAVSLLSIGLYLAEQAHAATGQLAYELPHVRDVLGVHGLLWQVLVTLGLVNALYSAYVWCNRTASFRWLAHRPGDDKAIGPSEL